MLINNQSSRDEVDSVLNNQSDSLGASHHVNQVSQYVILNIDKSTLEYKNNKNLILKQSLNNNNINRESHHNFEKHLNDINQLRKELQEKRFISPVGMCENLNNNMKHSSVPLTVPKIETFHVKGTEQLSNERVVCSLDKAEAMRANILRPKRSQHPNRFASVANENHFHGISLHESPKTATNAKSIPCIVIQGNASDLNNKTLNGPGLTGKLWCARLRHIAMSLWPESSRPRKRRFIWLLCLCFCCKKLLKYLTFHLRVRLITFVTIRFPSRLAQTLTTKTRNFCSNSNASRPSRISRKSSAICR